MVSLSFPTPQDWPRKDLPKVPLQARENPRSLGHLLPTGLYYVQASPCLNSSRTGSSLLCNPDYSQSDCQERGEDEGREERTRTDETPHSLHHSDVAVGITVATRRQEQRARGAK